MVSRANLPRVWERVEGGLCEPLRPNVSHSHPTRVGGDIDEVSRVGLRVGSRGHRGVPACAGGALQGWMAEEDMSS